MKQAEDVTVEDLEAQAYENGIELPEGYDRALIYFIGMRPYIAALGVDVPAMFYHEGRWRRLFGGRGH